VSNVLRRARILVVEDDEGVAGSLTHLVTRRMGLATVVTTVRAATRQLGHAGAWTAFIVDEHLPDGSGVSLIATLSRMHASVPALLLTGFPDNDVANAAFDFGARYLVKPATTAQIEHFLFLAEAEAANSPDPSSAILNTARVWSDRYRLSSSESEILALAAEGQDRHAIATARNCSPLTIQKHVSNLLRKTADESFHDVIERLLREAAGR
jgi:DNA-binding NarL/FixJ family response regulator